MALLFVISSITVGAVVHIFISDSEVLIPSPKEKSSYELLQQEKKKVQKKIYKSSPSRNTTFQVKKLNTGEKININKADIYELMRIPGVGEKTAKDIYNLRIYLGGKFTTLNQLTGVKSISDKKLEKLKEFMVLTDE